MSLSRKFRRRANSRRVRNTRRMLLEALEQRHLMAAVTISSPGGDMLEGSSPSYYRIQRDTADSQPLTVYFTITGDAIEGADYYDIGDSVVIPANEYWVDLAIEPIVDNEYEPSESVSLTVNANANYTLGTQITATADIIHCNGYSTQTVAVPPYCEPCFAQQGEAVNTSNTGWINPILFPGNTGGWISAQQSQNLSGSSGIVAGDQWMRTQNVPVVNPDPAVQPVSLPNGVVYNFGPSGFSSHPVRYTDGSVLVQSQDLASEGMGTLWGVSRAWTNAQSQYRNNVVGTRMFLNEQPYVNTTDNSRFWVVTNSTTVRAYDLVSGQYVARDFAQESLTHDDVNDEFAFTDTEGGVLRFYDYSTGYPKHKRGQFKSFTDASGNTVSVTSHFSDGRIQEMQRSYTEGSTTITESLLYTQLTTLVNYGLVDSVVLRRQEGAGSWVTQRKVEYEYYGNDEDHGNRGDLKTATIKDASDNVLDTTYYRYYKPGESNGFTHGLKYAVYPDSFERLVQAEGSNLAAIADQDLAPYSDYYFEYDSYLKVTKEIAQGAGCSACSGGQGQFTYSYTDGYGYENEYNVWDRKTVETLPDGNQNIVYTNFRGQVILQVFKDTTTSDEWATYYRYDNEGRVVFRAEPSAVSGYSESNQELVKDYYESTFDYLRDYEGQITHFTYYSSTTATSSTAGGAAGYLATTSIQQGEFGDAIPQAEQDYIARSAGGTTVYLPATSTVYANTDGTGAMTTSNSYTFFTDTVQVQSQTTTNAAGDAVTVYVDDYGRPTWKKDAEGYIHYVAYDNRTGAIVKSIIDVDTSETGDFTGLPSGWSTPTGAGVHLITTVEVDGLGRPTKKTDANGNVTYVVYDDDNHEVRVYPGWNSSTNLPTGPTIVMREDRDGKYSEVLTMSATPSVTSGRPTGTESISSLQSLTRTHFNDAGQAIYEDAYFSFNSLTYSTSASLGTQGTHFYRTEVGYDSRGRQARTVRPDGTIYRTVFDGLGRPVSEWIGDDDTPETGFWSPSNPAGMIKVRDYEYDGGDVGDSHLTSVTDAISRETTLEYDFRGRVIETTLPDPDSTGPLTSPVYATTYDNLGRVVSQTDALGNVTAYAFDTGDRETTVTMPDPDGSGGLSSPSIVLTYNGNGLLVSSKDPLNALTTYAFDGAGRLISVTEPDPDGTGSQTAPVTEYEYDGVGNLRFVTDALNNVTERDYDKASRLVELTLADPDGAGSLTAPVTAYAYNAAGLLYTITDPLNRVTSFLYDALGRRTKVTAPDPDGAGSQSAPETEYEYDAASRLVTGIDALDNETAYAYDYFDNLVEITAPDPDGAGSLTSPVTTYDFDNAGQLLEMTDPLSRVTSYAYDGLGRQIKVTAPDPDGAGSQTRPETLFTYDAVGNLLQQIDPLGNRSFFEYDNLYRTIAEKQASGNVPTVSVSTTTQGASANEVQRVGFISNDNPISGGTFTLTYDGQTTSSIDWNASAAAVKSELEALSNIGSGDLSVSKVTDTSMAQVWQIEFQGSLAATNVVQTTIDTSSVFYATLTEVESTTTQGVGADEVQVVTISNATGGTFSLTFGGQTTAAIAYNATAATVETALENLSSVDNVSVSGSTGGPYTVTFLGTHAGQNVSALAVDASGLTSTSLLSATYFTFDAAGRMLSLQDPVNNTTTWQYDALGRVTQETNQLSKTRTFKYNAIGNLTERVDRLGRKIVWEYDNLYRNTAEKWYDGANLVRTLSITYDAANQLLTASDPAAGYEYDYDDLGRLTTEEQQIEDLPLVVEYQSKYNALGSRTELLALVGGTADFKNTYLYDNLQRLTVLKQESGGAGPGATVVAPKRVEFAYNAASQFAQIDRYADLSGTEFVASSFYSYDGMGRLSKLTHNESSTFASGWGNDPLAGYAYAYDLASRFTSIDSYVDGLTSYTHDDTDQLTGADHTGMSDETYSYDENGNRTMSGYDTGDNNQLLTDGTYDYEYDDEGNRSAREKISTGEREEYTWDHRNRLTNITFKNSGGTVTKTVEQTYDVFNRWVRRRVDPDGATGSAALVDTYFSHEDGQVVFQYDDNATADTGHRYLWNPGAVDQLLADEFVTSFLSAGDVLWSLADHLGTIRDMADYDSGTDDTSIANHRGYDSYGKLNSETNAAVDLLFGFTGRARDESTGLQNNLNRWYDTAVGQWISEDPIGFDAGDTNTRRYVGNKSLLLIDPMGLWWQPPPVEIPPQTIGNYGGVEIRTYGTGDVHKPAHAHVCGQGREVRIGIKGYPLAGEPPLSPHQRAAVEKLRPQIRKTLNKIGRRNMQIERFNRGVRPGMGVVDPEALLWDLLEYLHDPDGWMNRTNQCGAFMFPGMMVFPNRPARPPYGGKYWID